MVETNESVQIQRVPKNNGVILTGICILKKGGKITPTIYLGEYYDRFHDGCGMKEIAEAILQKHRELETIDDADFRFYSDFEKVRSRIVFRLVNYEQNKLRLTEMPFEPYLDLAVVFYCHVETSEGGQAAIPIYKNHMKLWKVGKEELIKHAKKNTPKLFPCEIIDMKSMMPSKTDPKEQEVVERMIDEMEHCFMPMFILTNSCKLNGASVILYPHVLSDFAKACGGNFYVLPSSIHEVLLMPDRGKAGLQDMSHMVLEVNRTQLDAEEVLADHAYYYDAEQGRLLY